MAPKGKKAKAAPAKKLEPPLVSDKDLCRAKESLKAEQELKKQRANMMYYLQANNQKDAYDASSISQKKEFLHAWFADKLASRDGLTNLVTSTGHATEAKSSRNFTWMSEESMIKQLGEAKAIAHIESGRLTSRPDQITGSNDKLMKEFKVYVDGGGDEETVRTDNNLSNVQAELSESKTTDAMCSMSTCKSVMAGGNELPKAVKPEPGTAAEGTTASSAVGSIELPPPTDCPHKKSCMALSTDSRKVLRNIGDVLTTLKSMFEKTSTLKYATTLQEDIAKMIPKFAKAYKSVECFHLKSCGSEDEPDEAVVLALATMLDDHFDAFDEVSEWYDKLAGGKTKKTKKS
jgi:hypothetical protein